MVGLSIAIPAAQLVFLRSVWARSRASFALGLVSFAGLAITMALAWRNELSMGELVSVATGRRFGDSVVITQGLKSGDVVVTEGQTRVQPGAMVRVARLVPASAGR